MCVHIKIFYKSLFPNSIYETKKNNLTMEEVENSFASNICRCTGYRPIADAFKTFANNASEDLINKLVDLEDLSTVKCKEQKCYRNCPKKDKIKTDDAKKDEDWCVIEKSSNKMIVVDCGITKWYKTYLLDDVFKVISKSNNYKLIAGNTGQGLFIK